MTGPRPAKRSAFAPGALTNHDLDLVPQPSPGRDVVEFDLPGVYTGTAEYGEGPTGCTVIYVPEGARTAVDARGGAVGLSGGYRFHHAIAIAGGSVYGLEAAAGVSTELLHRAENRTHWAALAHVSGAVVYDFSVRDTAIAPDAALGRAALENRVEGKVPVGQCGAGRSTSVGKIDYDRAEFELQGTLAAAVMAGDDDAEVPWLIDRLGRLAGRVTVNDWPTGVAVSWAQHHGGPWPSTTNPATTSVGAAALTRFTRPVAYQNVPDTALPPALREGNPWRLPRRVVRS